MAPNLSLALSTRDKDALSTAEKKQAELETAITTHEALLAEALEHAEALAKAEEARAQKKLEAEESTRAMSDAGAVLLVDLKLGKFAPRFDNNTDTVDAVWEELHVDFMNEGGRGRHAAGHRRPVGEGPKALQTR